jgi:lipoyl(octanoyl) transferase
MSGMHCSNILKKSRVARVFLLLLRWVTMHGLSLNLSPDLVEDGGFKRIVPCGIEG